MAMEATKTEHPHIVRVMGAAGEKAVIAGTRISVVFIVRQIAAGDSPEDIAAALPHLTLAGIYDAVSFYHDHRSEIDASIADSTPEKLAERYGFEVAPDGKVTFRPD